MHLQEVRDIFDHAGVDLDEFILFNMREAFAVVHQDGSIVYANPMFCSWLGYSAVEMAQLKFVDITPSPDAEYDLKLFDQLVKREIPMYTMDKTYRTKSGSLIKGKLKGLRVGDQNIYFCGMVLPSVILPKPELTQEQKEEIVAAFIGAGIKRLLRDHYKKIGLIVIALLAGTNLSEILKLLGIG